MKPQRHPDDPMIDIPSLIGRLFYFAHIQPQHDALITPNVTYSYAQLRTQVIAQADILAAQGISEKAIVGIHCADDVAHFILTLAACYVGATSCTIPSYETEEAQQNICERCGVTHVLDASSYIANPAPSSKTQSSQEHQPVECQLLFSTSGSTGTPKLVIHHDTDLVAQAHRHIGSINERFTCRATMEHNFAKRHRLYCLAVGGTNVFLSTSQETLIKECLQLRVNVIHVSAFQAQELVNLPDIQKLKHIRLKLGGSHVPLALREALRTNITSTLQAGYGTTETGAIAFTDPDDLEAGESVGQPLPGIEIRIVNHNRESLTPGERGEVAIRCKGMFRGYLGNVELTNKRLSNDWFYTGDIAYLDEKQRIHLCGRSDDMFTFNSMNIYPQEIETVIKAFPDVTDAIVLPKSSTAHGNIPIALVVYNPYLRPDLTALKKFVEKTVGLRSPRQYTFVDKIPTNATGKVSRAAAVALSEKSNEFRTTLISLIDDKLIKQTDPHLIKDFINNKRDLTFRKLNMDSLARMNLLVAIEVDYDIVISPQALIRLRTLGKLASKILEIKAQVAQASEEKDNKVPISFEGLQNQEEKPYIVRLFQRFIQYCDTATQLNQIFSDLEYRLTPLDVANLDQAYYSNVLANNADHKKLSRALSDWLNETKSLMFNSGRKIPQTFIFKRIKPHVTLFSNNEYSDKKSLIIGFAPRDAPHMMVPNSVLLQHIDAQKYDVLMIAGINRQNYNSSRNSFGQQLNELAKWLNQTMQLNQYREIRTLGFSSGGFPAIVIGYLLNATVALSVGSRLHKRKHLIANIEQILTIRRAYKTGNDNCTIASYSASNKRDKKFAALLTRICNAKTLAIEIKNENLPHLPLRRLIERGELKDFFAHTLFSDEPLKYKRDKISFPLEKNTNGESPV